MKTEYIDNINGKFLKASLVVGIVLPAVIVRVALGQQLPDTQGFGGLKVKLGILMN